MVKLLKSWIRLPLGMRALKWASSLVKYVAGKLVQYSAAFASYIKCGPGQKPLGGRPLSILAISVMCALGLEYGGQYLDSIWVPKGKEKKDDFPFTVVTTPRTISEHEPEPLPPLINKGEDGGDVGDSAYHSGFSSSPSSELSSPCMESISENTGFEATVMDPLPFEINSDGLYDIPEDLEPFPETDFTLEIPQETIDLKRWIESPAKCEPKALVTEPFTPPNQIIVVKEYPSSEQRRFRGSDISQDGESDFALQAERDRNIPQKPFYYDSQGSIIEYDKEGMGETEDEVSGSTDSKSKRNRKNRPRPINHFRYFDPENISCCYLPFEPVPFKGFTDQLRPGTPSDESEGDDEEFEEELSLSPSPCLDAEGNRVPFDEKLCWRSWNFETETKIFESIANLSGGRGKDRFSQLVWNSLDATDNSFKQETRNDSGSLGDVGDCGSYADGDVKTDH
ncbi:hypothetical protein PRK78_006036 [Emydomyces testavorans]|uniref:Uncharacterized protein n=1 Tax=Emydomyces testavorans TaxID=2070801 RepID=A0AAF0DKP2_9EURO|nr:hypothetical protein PRK78_006036 [Emydomyces testavorans]